MIFEAKGYNYHAIYIKNNIDMTIPDLIKARADKYNSKTFLFFKDLTLTYRRLDEITDSLSSGLKDIGVKKGGAVCILLPNLPEFLYAFFGIIKAGAVAVPINFNLKGDEVKYIINNSEATIIVTSPAYLDTIEGIRKECPLLKEVIATGETIINGTISINKLLESLPTKIIPDLTEDDPASIIYTSGTTGRPKGVILTHKNYLFDTERFVQVTGMTEEDRFLCILPLFHVNGQVVTTLSPIYAGASMILMEKFSPTEFFPALSKYRPTAFSAVPTIYAILLNHPAAKGADLSGLRFCICGAAPMPVELFQRFEERFNTYILEGYGLSEGTCVSSINPLGGKRKIGSIGLPLPGQDMRIFDDVGKELPTREIGEIVIRGDNVMACYFKNPDATRDAIRKGWLHTGDLGYKDSGGYFFIIGRKKEMIIRGGENIYPKEIEDVLYRHPNVMEAAVVGLPDKIWGEEVYAFIVPKEGRVIDVEDLVGFCKKHLADFKCPKRITFTDSLPKTATGKIQKARLKEEYKEKGDKY